MDTHEPFDGYPYLVTRIGRCALRHMAILPADWPYRRLLDLARRQAEANQMETCLCLGPAETVFVSPEGRTTASTYVPTGLSVIERLALAEPIPDTTEVAARREALRAYNEGLNAGGYIVGDGLEAGRPADREDIHRLSRRQPDGPPPGLSRCPTCGVFAGDYLTFNGEGSDRTADVVRVHCRCENHHRCAGCGETLADRRLSAWQYDEAIGRARYLGAYVAFSHRCSGISRSYAFST
jgi:hypothetical protein